MKGIGILLLIGMSLIGSCAKENLYTNDYPMLVGDYDWSYSTVDSNSGISKENSENFFGVRIYNDGRMNLYRNGENIGRGKLILIDDLGSLITFDFEERKTRVRFQMNKITGELTSLQFPLSGLNNEFERL